MSQIEKGPAATQGGLAPPGRMSAPEYADYHMIFDHELDQLTRPEGGILGSIGYMAIGAAIGFIPAIVTIATKAKLQPSPPIEIADLSTIAAFSVSLTAAIVCLSIYSISQWKNRGLVGKIRARKRVDLSTTTPG